MKRRLMAGCLQSLMFVVVVGAAQSPAQDVVTYRHAYYLFLAPPADACETCYIPLLLTSRPLDEWSRENQDQTCVVITTYERDSIVRVERGVVVSPANVSPQPRHVRLRERAYRYQEVSASEVLRLLERPEGTIPIHRTIDMSSPARAQVEDLISSFRSVDRSNGLR